MVVRNSIPTGSQSENDYSNSSIQLDEPENCDNDEAGRDEKLSSVMKSFFSQIEITPQSSFADLTTKHECYWTQEQFILVDKEEETLPSAQEKLFNQHLQSCFSCSEELETSKQVRQLISFPEIEPTRSLENFWQKVRCDEFQVDFIALLKQEISSERAQEIQSHLKNCFICALCFQQVQTNLKQIAPFLREQEIEPPSNGWEILKNKLETSSSSSSEKNEVPYWRYVVSTFFLAAGLFLLATLVQNKFEQTPPRLISGNLLHTSANQSVLYGTSLQTGNFVAALEMEGIQLLANKNTQFTLQSSSAIFLEQGELLVQVPKGKGHSLTVKTPHANALVLGTKFHIQTDKKETTLAVLEGHVSFASKKQKIQASLGTEAIIDSTDQLNIVRQVVQDKEKLLQMEQDILKKYQKNALSLSLEYIEATTLRCSFTNHGLTLLQVVPIKPNTPSYSWTISGPQGKIQIPASPTLNLTVEKNLLIGPGKTTSILYDVSPYLTTPGEYELFLNYLVNEQPQSHFWTGHLQSNVIRLSHPH